MYARAPYLDPSPPTAAATTTGVKGGGTDSAESDARHHHAPVPASHPVHPLHPERPVLRNRLPTSISNTELSLDCFRRKLKTFYFHGVEYQARRDGLRL